MQDQTQGTGLARVRMTVIMEGQVQGVFLRSSVRNRARVLRVSGWIRNLLDGKVEAVFEGDRDSVDELIAYCRRGPGGAHVENCTATEGEYTGEFDGFEIRNELIADL